MISYLQQWGESQLDKSEFDGKVVEAIARQNPHKLIFMLIFEDKRQLAVYHQQINKTKSAMWKEIQPKKKFELHTRLRDYQQKLENLKNGKA